MDCKRALEASAGDIDKAVTLPLEQGIARAEKNADRVTAQGLVECYIHAGAHRRARRGQLRDGLRRPHATIPDAGARDRDADRRRQPARGHRR